MISLDYGHRVITCFVSLIIISIITICLTYPNTDKNSKRYIYDQTPLFLLENFTYYSVGIEGVSILAKASNAQKYKSYAKVEDILITKIDKKTNLKEEISSKSIKNEEYKISFDDYIQYKRSDGISFKSSKGVYDTRKNIFTTSNKFYLKNKDSYFVGDSIVANFNKYTLEASNINANITNNQNINFITIKSDK